MDERRLDVSSERRRRPSTGRPRGCSVRVDRERGVTADGPGVATGTTRRLAPLARWSYKRRETSHEPRTLPTFTGKEVDQQKPQQREVEKAHQEAQKGPYEHRQELTGAAFGLHPQPDSLRVSPCAATERLAGKAARDRFPLPNSLVMLAPRSARDRHGPVLAVEGNARQRALPRQAETPNAAEMAEMSL